MKKCVKDTGMMKMLLKLSLPAMGAQLFNAIYNLSDRIFIGHIEGCAAESLSGIGLCFPITSLLTAFSWLVGMGGAPLLSICLGKGQQKEAEKIEGNAFVLVVTMGLLSSILCYFGADVLLKIFGASAELLPYARVYLQIYGMGSVAVMISMGMNAFINAQGRTDYGTVTVGIGAGVNIVLDYLFIMVFQFGIKGAAVATVLAQTISALWVTWLLFRSSVIKIHVKREFLKPIRNIIARIITLGSSSFVFMLNESLAAVVLNWLIRICAGYNEKGDLYIAGMTVVTSLSQIFFMPLKGITQGAQPIVSYCYGSGKYEKMKEAIHDARICAFVCASAFWLIYMIFPNKIATLFTSDQTLIHLFGELIQFSFWESFILGIQMVNQHMFVALGNAKWSFLFAIMRKLVLLIPLACLMSKIWGVNGIFFAEPIATVITAIFTQWAFNYYIKKIEEGSVNEKK